MTGSNTDWDALRRAIGGEVLLPDSPGYDAARRPASARFHDRRRWLSSGPVRRPMSARPSCSRGGPACELPPRSSGHCFAGRSSAGQIIIDLAPMCRVSVSAGIATVGTGVRLGDLNHALPLHGRTIPAGCGPSVGIAGLTLGGGLGVLGRKFGLTCDHLLGARVVLADGRVVDCDAQHEPDLFWALRGAGGGHFGVVTSLTFATLAMPVATSFRLEWTPEHAATVIAAWQHWAPAAPDELHAELRLSANGSGPPLITVHGAMLASDRNTGTVLAEFTARGSRP